MVNKGLIRLYFWGGGYVARGGWLISHEQISDSDEEWLVNLMVSVPKKPFKPTTFLIQPDSS